MKWIVILPFRLLNKKKKLSANPLLVINSLAAQQNQFSLSLALIFIYYFSSFFAILMRMRITIIYTALVVDNSTIGLSQTDGPPVPGNDKKRLPPPHFANKSCQNFSFRYFFFLSPTFKHLAKVFIYVFPSDHFLPCFFCYQETHSNYSFVSN